MRVIAPFLWALLLLQLIRPAAAQPAPVISSLAAAVAYAADHNPQIAASRAALRAAQAAVKVARAGLAPSVSVSASGSLGSSSPSASLSAGVTYLLFDGGLREAQIRQAEAQAQAAAEALAVVVADIALQTVQAYMAVITGDRLVVLREQAVTQAKTQLAAAEANFRAGRVARADVLRAESSVATAEFDLIDARGQGESRRSALRTVMGLQPGATVEV
ncbi:MAG: TolC family protein, partial [Candidatus Rokuibacteriota bacterium]